jgi:hypothetical protein
MLSSEDHSGVVYFLIGIVVIVFTAVGLSMLVDQRFRFSSGVGVLKREVALQTEEIADLTFSIFSRRTRQTGSLICKSAGNPLEDRRRDRSEV